MWVSDYGVGWRANPDVNQYKEKQNKQIITTGVHAYVHADPLCMHAHALCVDTDQCKQKNNKKLLRWLR